MNPNSAEIAWDTPPAEAQATPPAAAIAAPAAANSKSALEVEYARAAKNMLTADPALEGHVGALSESLEVVNTLKYGRKGGTIVSGTKVIKDTNGVEKTVPNNIVTGSIVGYVVRNVGQTPIEYVEEFSNFDSGIGAGGAYVWSDRPAVIAPGESKNITRGALARLAGTLPFNGTLANGRIKKTSAWNTLKTLSAAELTKRVREVNNAQAFDFFKRAGEPAKSQHDDGVAIMISKEVPYTATGGFQGKADPTTTELLPEYLDMFGALKTTNRAANARPKTGTLTAEQVGAIGWTLLMTELNKKAAGQ